ncbi:hypothetical protein IJH02_02355 [Candidatus Saccharibacteria bacterium]|nr:hypothetical protein [Candidatus Saccharibacteria bacterium]
MYVKDNAGNTYTVSGNSKESYNELADKIKLIERSGGRVTDIDQNAAKGLRTLGLIK